MYIGHQIIRVYFEFLGGVRQLLEEFLGIQIYVQAVKLRDRTIILSIFSVPVSN